MGKAAQPLILEGVKEIDKKISVRHYLGHENFTVKKLELKFESDHF